MSAWGSPRSARSARARPRRQTTPRAAEGAQRLWAKAATHGAAGEARLLDQRRQLGVRFVGRGLAERLIGEGQLAVLDVDADHAALLQLAEQQLLGERLLDVLLDHPGERPGAVQRVEPPLGQPV